MIKFINKKYLQERKGEAKIIITYSVTDIFLGIILMSLVIFFAQDYITRNSSHCDSRGYNSNLVKNSKPNL